MAHEVETMFSARETPWHRLGVVTPDALTASEAIVAAGLDWSVVKEPVMGRRLLHDADGLGYLTYDVPNRFNLVRDTDQRVMSIVSDVYRPFQNRDAFSFMDMLVDSGDAKYETAGSLRHGNVIFVTMEVPMDVRIGGEEHRGYLLLRNTHDGSGRISVYVVMVRVVCMNTLTYAIGGASHQWGVTHTADVQGKIQEARETLGLTFEYSQAFADEANRLLDVKVTTETATTLLESVMPAKTKREEEIDAILANLATSDTIPDEMRNTGWGLLNAVTEYREHGKQNRSGEALLTRTLDGPDAKLRANLSRRLLRV